MEGTFEKNIKALIYKIEKQNNLDVKNFKLVIDNYISIDESEFWNTIDKFRPDHLWTKQNNIWKLKHTVYD